MKKGFSIGSIVFLLIIIFVIVKVVMPKVNAVKDSTLGMASGMLLKGAYEDIKSDYFAQGELRSLNSSIKNISLKDSFNEADWNSVPQIDKPIEFSIGGSKDKGNMIVCARIIFKKDDKGIYLTVEPENHKRELCEQFQQSSEFQQYSSSNFYLED